MHELHAFEISQYLSENKVKHNKTYSDIHSYVFVPELTKLTEKEVKDIYTETNKISELFEEPVEVKIISLPDVLKNKGKLPEELITKTQGLKNENLKIILFTNKSGNPSEYKTIIEFYQDYDIDRTGKDGFYPYTSEKQYKNFEKQLQETKIKKRNQDKLKELVSQGKFRPALLRRKPE